MIKQITCKELKDHVKNNPKSVLLDVEHKKNWIILVNQMEIK